MKENIPFSEFYNFYQEDKNDLEFSKDKINRQTRWLNAMNDVTWKDLENLSPDEMIKIPICWIFDWTHVTANYDLQEKVEQLYKRYKLPIYSLREYLAYFRENKQMAVFY